MNDNPFSVNGKHLGDGPWGKEYPENIIDRFLTMKDEKPHNPALWVEGKLYSYIELWKRSKLLAASLFDLQSKKPLVSVAVIADRSITSFSAIISALVVGVPYVPIHPKYPIDKQLKILLKAQCSALIIDKKNIALAIKIVGLLEVPLDLIWAEDTAVPSCLSDYGQHPISVFKVNTRAPEIYPIKPTSKHLACILFTSGSTGEPKGIPITHANILAYLEATITCYVPSADDRFSQMFEQTFDLSIHDMFVAWSCGASVFCVPDKERHSPGRFIRQHKLTFWFSTPSTVSLMQRAKLLKKESFLTLRVSLFCGEALPTKVAKSWLGAAPNSRLDNLYGPTETTIAITRFTVTEATLNEGYNIIPIGMPFPNQKACLLDERGNLSPLDSGAVGELLFNGSQVTIGYWCDESAATDKFSNTFKDIGLDYTFYRTGDLARYDDYCGFQFLGRLDDQVKVRGYRVELLEVEGVVRKVSNAASVAVVAWPKTEMGVEGLIAFIESDALEEVEDIRIECTKLLPSYMVPRKFICLDNIPRNTNNKIDKEKLFNMLDRGAV